MYTRVDIFPTWSRSEVAVRWGGAFPAGTRHHVYRSASGESGWVLRNEVGVEGNHYIDTIERTRDFDWQPAYRLVSVLPGGREAESDVVKARDALTKYEREAVRGILYQEYLGMAHGDGLRVWHFPVGSRLQPLPGTDPDLGQQVGATCPQYLNDAGLVAYDGWIDAFAPPRQTWLRLYGPTQNLRVLDPNGLGAVEVEKQAARLLAWPCPQEGDLFVHGSTDRRWVVKPGIRTPLFAGHVPLMHTVELQGLPRGHDLYRMPVPADIATGKHLVSER